jgi:hypothetical protein
LEVCCALLDLGRTVDLSARLSKSTKSEDDRKRADGKESGRQCESGAA